MVPGSWFPSGSSREPATPADRRASHSPGRCPVPGSAEFCAAIRDAPDDQRDLLERACDWAESLARDGLATLVTSRGPTGLVSLLPRLADDSAGLVIIYRDVKSAYMMFQRSVFDAARRAPSPPSKRRWEQT